MTTGTMGLPAGGVAPAAFPPAPVLQPVMRKK